MKEKRKDLILITIDDMVTDFLYYDRKEDESKAAQAYDIAAKKYFGEFARINLS